MDLNKIPRWALIAIAGLGMTAGGTLISNARADMDKLKVVSYAAKNLSESNQASIVDMKQNVDKIQTAQETFRKEYREDQKDLDRKLGELLVAVRK